MSPDLEINQEKGLEITRLDNFRYRTSYFTDSRVIGSKKFVKEHYQRFKGYFDTKKDKIPISIKGLDGVYSLKRLATNML